MKSALRSALVSSYENSSGSSNLLVLSEHPGPPVVCGSEIYVKEGNQIRTFGLQTGVEQKRNMLGSARLIKH